MRLAVLTNAPAPYRVPIFERMAREDGVELRVFFDGGQSTARTTLPFPHEQLRPGWVLRRPNYQDEERFAEQIVMRFGWRYLPRLSAFRPDVVISGEFGWRTLHAASYAALAGVPLLVWWEGTRFTERHVGPLRTSLRRALALRAAGLLGFGSGSVECLETIAPSGTPVCFVPQAVDNARIAREVDAWRVDREALRAELGLRGSVLLCVSRLLPHKGIPELLGALKRLHADSPEGTFTALLAGDGPLHDTATRTARDLDGALQVLGAVPPAEIPKYLAAADVLVFPTLRDCWGMVVNEALAAGVPVLGSRYAGACDELLERDEARGTPSRERSVGRRFDPLDPSDFDAALRATVLSGCFRDTSTADLRGAVAGHTCEEAARALLESARGVLAGDLAPSTA